MPTRERNGGFAVLWVVAVLALFTLATAGLMWARGGTPDPVWMGICTAVAATCLAIEARRDRNEFLRLFGAFAFISALGCGAVALSDGSHPVAMATAGLSAIAAAACGLALWRQQYGDEPLPNVLRERLDDSVIVELDGVQFVASCSDGEVLAGEEIRVQVLAQNGFDTERRLEIGLTGHAGLGKRGTMFFSEKSPTLVLPGGAAGLLTIPIATHPRARGSYKLLVDPQVHGTGGVRVRRWRAKPFSARVSPRLQFLGLLVGMWAWGGGLEFAVKIRRNRDAVRGAEPETPAPSEQEIVYQPEPTVLAGWSQGL
ncbi:MAG: hypothetical protein MJE66_13155 [Proteobacteria bacterium]|nr:hypothetical protein [Pseudomonadota bacterium]